jgi:signal transduction histidine kinase
MRMFFNKLPVKTSLHIFIIMIFPLAFIGYLYIDSRFAEIDQGVSKRLAIPGILMSQGVLSQEEVRTPQNLSKIIQQEVIDTYFINNDGTILYSASPEKEGEVYLGFLDKREIAILSGSLPTVKRFFYETSDESHILINFSPIWSKNKFAGSLYMKVNGQEILSRKNDILFSYLYWAFIVDILFTVVTGLTIHLYIMSRITTTLDVLDKAAKGDYSQEIIVQGASDKIGRLMSQIKAMITKTEQDTYRLQETIQKLHTEMEKRQDMQLQLMHAEKLSALGRLSASIVHEFGNPLLGVSFMLEDINRRVPLSQEDKQLIYLGVEECERMKALLRNMREFNKPSSEIKASFNIEQSIDNILTFQDKYFKSNNIDLIKKYNLFFPEIIAIEDQITQVLINIVINAASAIPETGGTITVSTDIVDNNNISIEITDSGVGISAENQKRIFEPFFSTKTDGDGTGLGLTVSYGIIQSHGGTIRCKSQIDKGTTFQITLPTGYEYACLPQFA